MANLLAILGADGRTTRAMLAGAALRHAARESGCKLDVDVRSPDTLPTVDTKALSTADAVVWAGVSPDNAARQANPRTIEVTIDEVLDNARAVHSLAMTASMPSCATRWQYRARRRPTCIGMAMPCPR